MKTMLILFIGLCLGFIVCYMMLPYSDLSQQHIIGSTPEIPKVHEMKYNHDEEGIRLQTFEMLDIADYISTEGNSAELFSLGEMCKVRVNIVGETYYRYRTFYFSKHQLNYAMQTLYRYPNGGLSNMDAPNAFKEELYSNEILNPKSGAVLAEFKELISRFSPAYLNKC